MPADPARPAREPSLPDGAIEVEIAGPALLRPFRAQAGRGLAGG